MYTQLYTPFVGRFAVKSLNLGLLMGSCLMSCQRTRASKVDEEEKYDPQTIPYLETIVIGAQGEHLYRTVPM